MTPWLGAEMQRIAASAEQIYLAEHHAGIDCSPSGVVWVCVKLWSESDKPTEAERAFLECVGAETPNSCGITDIINPAGRSTRNIEALTIGVIAARDVLRHHGINCTAFARSGIWSKGGIVYHPVTWT